MIGTLLFWLAVIIDGCDGEVARLKFQESRLRLHASTSRPTTSSTPAIFIGLGMGIYRAAPDGNLFWLVMLGVGGFAAAAAATLLTLVRQPPAQDRPARTRRGKLRQQLLRGFEALMNRDFAYVLLALAVIGRLDWFLWGRRSAPTCTPVHWSS